MFLHRDQFDEEDLLPNLALKNENCSRRYQLKVFFGKRIGGAFLNPTTNLDASNLRVVYEIVFHPNANSAHHKLNRQPLEKL